MAIGPWAVAGIKGEDPVNGASFQTALGPYSAAIGNGSLALGGANAIPQWSIAIGSAKVGEGDGLNPVLDSGGEYGIAIGRSASTTDNEGIAIGHTAKAPTNKSISIGVDSESADGSSIAIGENAKTHAQPYNSTTASVAIGKDSKAASGVQ